MSEVAAEKQKALDRYQSISDSSQRTVKTLETRIQSLQNDVALTYSELNSVQAEYDGYKVYNREISHSRNLDFATWLFNIQI